MKHYKIPAEETRIETNVVNSRFIATIAPAFSVNEAKAFIKRIRLEFSDASHNVPAFIVGHGVSVTTHSSDDGEPSGTAGRPALAVLQGSDIGDAAVVVTRYFGGTKLGKGGLVRAYGDAVREVLKIVPLAEKVRTHIAMMAVPYNLYERIITLIKSHHGKIENEEFTDKVTITCRIMVDLFLGFQNEISELSSGSLSAEIIETDEATIMPIGAYPNLNQTS